MGIRTLIAMSPNGLPYFSANYICPNGNNCDVLSKDDMVDKDPLLISGFFSVLSEMAKQSGGEFQHVAFEKFQYIADSSKNLIMLMSINSKDDINDYKNRLQFSIDIFLENFGSLIEKWDGNYSLFNMYQTLLDDADFFDVDPEYRKNCVNCHTNQDCTFRMVTGVQGIDFKEKMKNFPRDKIFKRLLILMKEYFKYLGQLKRFKKFKRDFHKQKEKNLKLKIVEFRP
ncbi:MAG: hypothetical protein ACTSPA_01055 [Promethearchaeota archaeon]